MSHSPRPRALIPAAIAALLISLLVPAARPAFADTPNYIVDINADTSGAACLDATPGDCSLRDALLKANSDAAPSTITFIGGALTITPLSPLPALIDSNTTIRATSGGNGLPRVTIDGNGLNAIGLDIRSSNNRIEGLVVVGFARNAGIRVTAASPGAISGNVLVGNFVGVPPNSAAADANGTGIEISGATGTQVGGTTLIERNVVAGNSITGVGGTSNTGVGINIINGATNTTIRGNLIGVTFVNLALTVAGNTGDGIRIDSSSTTSVGGSNDGELNYIGGNGGAGVRVRGASAANNTLSGNLIGTDENGASGFGNSDGGVIVEFGAKDTTITGSTSPAARSVIAGNTGYGVLVRDDGTDRTTIINTSIGVQPDGLSTRPNTLGGVRVEDNPRNTVIGRAGTPNVIAGNGGYGISLGRTTSSGNTDLRFTSIAANIIGLNASATAALPNTAGGIEVGAGAAETTIGGGNTADGNVIGGHGATASAIVLTTAEPTTTIQHNIIGLRRATVGAPFTTSAPNRIGISAAANARALTIADNQIAYNAEQGILIGDGARDTTVRFNQVYTNTLTGVSFGSSTFTRIDDNTVRGNAAGIMLGATTAVTLTGNTVRDNIGTGIVLGATTDLLLEGTTTILRNTGAGLTLASLTRGTILDALIERNGGAGIAVTGAVFNVTVGSTKLITNTGDGLTFGAGNNVLLNNNTARGNTGAGFKLAATDALTLTANLARANTSHGIETGTGLRTLITGNTLEANGRAGLALSARTGAMIEDNIFTANNEDGAQIGAGSALRFARNSATTNRNQGINLFSATDVQFVGDSGRDNLGSGLVLNGVTNARVESGTFDGNDTDGVRIIASTLITVTGQTSLRANGTGSTGNGITITGAASRVRIENSAVISNTLYGVQIGDGGTGPHPQRVTVTQNSITRNGIPAAGPFPVGAGLLGRGIVLLPDTAAPGTVTNPNHDIDPPALATLTIDQQGTITGSINVTADPAACPPAGAVRCTIEFFRTDAETGDRQGADLITSATVNATGVFSASLGALLSEVALTATDGQGNTSSFGRFAANPLISISSAVGQTAGPGDTITYVHTVRNDGNVALADLRLSASSSRGWTQIVRSPAGSFALAPGATRQVSVTVTLPTGSATSVAAGGIPDALTVTVASAATPAATATTVDTTTVAGRVLLSVVPSEAEVLVGRGRPGETLPYAYTITNSGNLPVTLAVAVTTDLNVPGEAIWVTTPSVATITVPAGQPRGISFTVKIPTTGTRVISGTTAISTLTLTTISPVVPAQNKTLTARSIVTLDTQATLVESQTLPGAADEVISFIHRVENRSNGIATFRIRAQAAFGSEVTFAQASGGVPLSADPGDARGASFTLGTVSGGPPAATNIIVNVRVNRLLDNGDVESILVRLFNERGEAVGGAFVQDRVTVQQGARRPRVYLPVLSQ